MKPGRLLRYGRRGLVFGLLGALLVLKLFVVDIYTIPQNGMYPGLPGGSRFLALKRPFRRTADVRRGDIVVFTQKMADSSYTFVWRVVGLPGDRVEIGENSVAVNGHVLQHQQMRTNGNITIFRETNGDATYEVAYDGAATRSASPTVLTVPPSEFFVLGDNRDDALDSRFNGTVPFTAIFARKLPR